MYHIRSLIFIALNPEIAVCNHNKRSDGSNEICRQHHDICKLRIVRQTLDKMVKMMRHLHCTLSSIIKLLPPPA